MEGEDTENTTAEGRQEEKGRRAKRRGRGGIAMETMGMEMEGGIENGVDSIELESECSVLFCVSSKQCRDLKNNKVLLYSVPDPNVLRIRVIIIS